MDGGGGDMLDLGVEIVLAYCPKNGVEGWVVVKARVITVMNWGYQWG